MAYTMIAERNHQTVRKQRESALIVLANARAMESEGWQVVIHDGDGGDFDPAQFEATLAQKFSSWYQIKPQPAARSEPAAAIVDQPEADEFESETLVAAELAAEELEAHEMAAEELDTDESELHEVDETEFEEAALALDEVESDDAEFDEVEFDETEMDDLELAETEPAE
jgi:hypothetical protein